ncbi:unnamed protein product [Larinioides sclopetarius]|uniref:Uncharacterized protein n=1 Tax=Larinioides sclopetarius TaxID=280406 RepID=A0AAV1Z824_9ARAC
MPNYVLHYDSLASLDSFLVKKARKTDPVQWTRKFSRWINTSSFPSPPSR